MDPLVIQNVRPLPLGPATAGAAEEPGDIEPVDVLVDDGQVTRVEPGIAVPEDARVHDADGRWIIPGLWDQHVHLGQVSTLYSRLDLSTTRSPEEAAHFTSERLAMRPGEPIVGWGHRPGSWDRFPTTSELDAVSETVPIVLICGDGHHGWLNSAAMRALGVPWREDVVREAEWFATYARLDEVVGAETSAETYRWVLADAAARGVTGLVDFEFSGGAREWTERWADGANLLRIRMATYADGLDAVEAAGLRTGDPIPGCDGLVRMGPLKIISDGSLNTRTAWCCEPYTDIRDQPDPRGEPNLSAADLRKLLARATGMGLEVSVHAIGDAAVREGLDAFEETGARGSIEHAQLIRRADVPRIPALGLRASVQPAHLLDDRDVTEVCWPDRAHRCFALRWLLDAGADLRLGSDAPVAPLDPWLAMAAAVHRSGDDRDPWHPDQALTVREALSASTDGWGTVAPGHPGDLVLLDANPYLDVGDSAAISAYLRDLPVAATYVAGRLAAPLLD